MRGVLLALAVLVTAPFFRRFGGIQTITLSWGETRQFAEEIAEDEAFERAIFRRELMIVVLIAALIAARIILI